MTTGRRINSNLLGQREPRALIDEANVSQGAIGEGKPPSTAQVVGVSIDAWDGTPRYLTPPVVSSGRWERLRLKRRTLKLDYWGGIFSIGGLQRRWWIVCQKRVCSIDPPGCQDIYDALHASRMPSGKYEVNVHITDDILVVKPKTAMDAASLVRGTTVYPVDKRVATFPMLH
ncbi:hypothetical protein HOY82DRAFT_631053 [Tuber indicum]|nr:hypothetical protein HOY82DRAFT_631053 [Tuber indicum]